MSTDERVVQDDLREIALEQLRKKRGLQGHVIAYLTVNALFVGIWFVTMPGGFFWPIFPMLGWGIGLAFNVWDVYWPERLTEDRIEREMQRLRRS
jgi:hypothetical protein